MVDLLLAFLVLMLIASLPAWPYTRQWGYYGAGGIAIMLVLVLVLMHLYVF
ncbi:MAG TPA: DUF3309 family protein [Acidobacteriaceae bacterium]